MVPNIFLSIKIGQKKSEVVSITEPLMDVPFCSLHWRRVRHRPGLHFQGPGSKRRLRLPPLVPVGQGVLRQREVFLGGSNDKLARRKAGADSNAVLEQARIVPERVRFTILQPKLSKDFLQVLWRWFIGIIIQRWCKRSLLYHKDKKINKNIVWAYLMWF